MLDWEWYGDRNTTSLFIHLLFKASYQANKWRGIDVKRGQLITGRIKLADELGISQQAIRTCLDRLKSTGEIRIETTNRYSLLTVVNYNNYQDIEDEPTSHLTNKQPAVNQQSTTSKEGKKERSKENTYKARPKDAAQVSEYALEISFNLDGQQFIDHYEANGWMRGKNKIKDWKACVRTWKKHREENKPPQQNQLQEFS